MRAIILVNVDVSGGGGLDVEGCRCYTELRADYEHRSVVAALRQRRPLCGVGSSQKSIV
jgi:hypothetical protein